MIDIEPDRSGQLIDRKARRAILAVETDLDSGKHFWRYAREEDVEESPWRMYRIALPEGWRFNGFSGEDEVAVSPSPQSVMTVVGGVWPGFYPDGSVWRTRWMPANLDPDGADDDNLPFEVLVGRTGFSPESDVDTPTGMVFRWTLKRAVPEARSPQQIEGERAAIDAFEEWVAKNDL